MLLKSTTLVDPKLNLNGNCSVRLSVTLLLYRRYLVHPEIGKGFCFACYMFFSEPTTKIRMKIDPDYHTSGGKNENVAQ